MSADWDAVTKDAINAAKGVLGGAWSAVSTNASLQFSLLVQTAEYIESHKNEMTPAEYALAVKHQKESVERVLTGYEAIGIAAAQNAIAAAVDVIVKAAPGLLGIL